MAHYITADSFGAELPVNWRQIAAFLNNQIDELGISEDRDACDELWEEYWRGHIGGPDVYMPRDEVDERPDEAQQ